MILVNGSSLSVLYAVFYQRPKIFFTKVGFGIWRLSLGSLYTLANGATPKKSKIILALEALERFRER